MSLRAYSEINLHIVWHVKHNDPVLRDETEMRSATNGPITQTAGSTNGWSGPNRLMG